MATLIIGTWSSKCENCGKSCDPHEKTHETCLGWSEKERAQKGCGVTYTHVTTYYTHLLKTAQRMRPDLIFINPFPSRGEEDAISY